MWLHSPREARREARELRRRRDAVWSAIRTTAVLLDDARSRPNPRVVRASTRWLTGIPGRCLFITKRPATAGDTVQRQTQGWLVKHGFDLPSVLVIPAPAARPWPPFNSTITSTTTPPTVWR